MPKKVRQVMTLPEKECCVAIRLVSSHVESKGRAAAGGTR
jgi:hypothetical protein